MLFNFMLKNTAADAAEHIPEQRLRALANNPRIEVFSAEEAHFSRCGKCIKRFIEFLPQTPGEAVHREDKRSQRRSY